MASKRTGRPPSVAHNPDAIRQIPLALPHSDVLECDAAAARAGLSRAEWMRQELRAAYRRSAAESVAAQLP